MSDPKPNNLSLVALMRAWMQLGEQPSLEVVRVVADHFSFSKDVQSSKVSKPLIMCMSTIDTTRIALVVIEVAGWPCPSRDLDQCTHSKQ